ncbi:hypothetical protein Tco_0411592 [Tanacetum coccineum]
MDNRSTYSVLDQFRDILQICPKVGNKKFEEPPLEKEILAFLASLGHSGDIRKITDIENKNTKKGNAMYYPRFTKLVVNFVMEKDPSIPRRNKVNWHYARDDPMFTTINVISRNEATQLYGAILPVALTNEDIRNSESYKEYYARASGTIPPKTKGSKKKANTDIITQQKPPTAPKEKKSGKAKQKTTELETISEADLTEAEQLKIITKRSRQETHSSHASGSGADEGTGVTPGVPDAPDYDSEDDISWKSSDDDQDDEQAQDDEDAGKNDVNETTQDDEDDDDHDDDEKVQDDDEHDVDETVQEDDDEEQTESDDDGDDFVHPKLTTHDDEIIHEEDTDEDDSSISSSDEEDSDNEVEGTNVEGAKSDEEATYEEDQGTEAVEDTKTDLDGRDEVMTDVILPQVQATQEIEDTHVTLTPVNPDGQQQSSSVSSGFVSNMLNPNQDTGVDDIFGQHTEATSLIDTPVTAIMEPSFTAQINRPPTPYPLDIQTQQPPIMTPATTTSSLLQNLPNFASLFGFDYRLKALEDNFSELRQTNQYAEALSSTPFLALSDIQRQLYKALVDAYEADKILLDTYGDTVTIKRHRDGADDDQEPSAGTDRGSKRRKSGKEPASTSAPSETTTKTAGKTTGVETGVTNEHLQKEVPPARACPGPTFELMKGTCKSLTELEYFCEEVYKATTEKLDWINPEGRQYPHDLRQPLPVVPNSQRESARDVYSKRRIIAVTKVEIVEWHDYKHLDWITVRRDDDVLYKFKEGDFHRLRIQDIEDMLLLLVQGKVTNLSVEERIAFNVSLRMFTRRVVIQRRVEDLQLGVESYQKKLNLTKPDTYRSNLRRQDAYTPYSDPRGFIYENKDKKNRLMRIDELHKFSDEHAEYDESNTYVLERFNTTAGNPVKKILLKLNLSDHRLFKDGGGVHKMAKFQDGVKRLCLVDDLKMLKITMLNTSSRNKLNPEVNDHYNIFSRESQEYELKTKDEA